MKKVGLWIQKRKAVVVTFINTKINIHHLIDKSRAIPKSTHPFVFKNIHRIIPINICVQHEEDHFKHIINYLSGAKRILIIGPDDTAELFYMHLRNYNKNICNSVCNVQHMEHIPVSKIANYFITYFRQ